MLTCVLLSQKLLLSQPPESTLLYLLYDRTLNGKHQPDQRRHTCMTVVSVSTISDRSSISVSMRSSAKKKDKPRVIVCSIEHTQSHSRSNAANFVRTWLDRCRMDTGVTMVTDKMTSPTRVREGPMRRVSRKMSTLRKPPVVNDVGKAV